MKKIKWGNYTSGDLERGAAEYSVPGHEQRKKHVQRGRGRKNPGMFKKQESRVFGLLLVLSESLARLDRESPQTIWHYIPESKLRFLIIRGQF